MKFRFLFILFFVISYAKCQSINGLVVNDNGVKMASASVSVTDNSNKIIAYAITDSNGNFTISQLKMGDYQLLCRALGYETYSEKISVGNANLLLKINLGKEKVREIKEVIISATKPITEKKDTIVIDVKSFLQGGERNTEELLKKIPGINVEEDGTVKIGNQEVEKIMVEGDDFFEKGYKVLTKNFPVEPLETVQVLKRYSNNKHLKNIENSDKVALNLTLKKGMKRRWVGNINLQQSFFPEAFHQSKFNLMNFGKKNKFYILGGYNNIGVDDTGNLTTMHNKKSTDEYDKLGESIGFSPLNERAMNVPELNPKRINFNKDYFVSYNSIFNPSEKLKINWSAIYNRTSKSVYRSTITEYQTQNVAFRNQENQVMRRQMPEFVMKANLAYDMSENKTLEVENLFYFSETDLRNTLVFNTQPLSEQQDLKRYKAISQIKLTHKLSEQSAWIHTLKFLHENNPEDYALDRNIYSDFIDNTIPEMFVFQSVAKKQSYLGLQSYYTKRTEKDHLLEFLFSGETNPVDINTNFSIAEQSRFANQLSANTSQLRGFAKYHFIFDKIEFYPQVEAFYINNHWRNFNQNQSSDFLMIYPKISAKWKLHKKGEVIGNWFYNFQNTNAVSLLPNFVNTGFRYFTKGLAEFSPLKNNGAFLYYNYGSWSDRFFINSLFGYTKYSDYISENTILNPNYSLSEQQIFKDRKGLIFSATFGYYFRFLKSTLKMNFGGNEFRYQNQINHSELRNIQSQNLNYGLELRSGWSLAFNYHIGTRWNFSSVKTENTNRFTSNVSFLDLILNVNKKLNIQLKNEYYAFQNASSGNREYVFSDVFLYYDVPKFDIKLSLSGNNLFNQKRFSYYHISDISRTETSFRLLPRYVMFGVDFRVK